MSPTATSPLLKLIFTTTSLRNVTIATKSDDVYYEIVTPEWDPLITKIRRLDSNTRQMILVAELKRQKSRAQHTGLRFVDSEKEVEFLAPEMFLSTGDGGKILGSFTGEDGKGYRWQESNRSAELVRDDEPEGKTLARFHKHHRHFGVLRMSEKPFLEMDTELTGSMDAFIVSFLIAEGRRRS